MAFFFKSKKNTQAQQFAQSNRDVITPPSSTNTTTTTVTSNAPSNSSQTNSASSHINEGTAVSLDSKSSPPQAQMDRSPPQPSSQFQLQPSSSSAPANAALYPWSQKKITLSSSLTSPFPRYGHAANAQAGKEGEIYIMGGLIRSQNVRGDLWLVEGGTSNISAYPVVTTSEGPGPRVGHASLLVGNAFIVFGGDTKMDEQDVLDETLYLLNTSSRQWSRAQPVGITPSGRYGHTLNIVGSKLFVFGGQAEGNFFNDLMSFDLNTLQSNKSHWDMLVDNTDVATDVPAKRTNHTVVTWGDKLFLFGGTNGMIWFNDVWSFDPRANAWSQLDCIGYIPSPREGHSASLVGDTMYIFGGRSNDGTDLGDLAAFRIPSRRWYTFQNMGPAPSPRSGHSMTTFGQRVVVLGGEPSVPSKNPDELTYVYILDTSKIRYPNDQQLADRERSGSTTAGMRRPSTSDRNGSMSINAMGSPPERSQLRKMSNAVQPSRDVITNGSAGSQGGTSPLAGNNTSGSSVTSVTGGQVATGSRLPRASISQNPVGPPPQQAAPAPRSASVSAGQAVANGRAKTPTRPERPQVETSRIPQGKESMSPVTAAPMANGRRTPIQQQTQPNQIYQQQAQVVQVHPQGTQQDYYRQQQQQQQHQQPALQQIQPQQGQQPYPNNQQQNRQISDDSIQEESPMQVREIIQQHQSSRSITPPSSTTPISPVMERAGSRQQMSKTPLDNTPNLAMAPAQKSMVNGRGAPNHMPSNSIGSSYNENVSPVNPNSPQTSFRELENLRQTNAWYASELALARRAGYTLNNTNPSSLLEESGTEAVSENDRPLLEALVAVKAELEKVQGSVETQASAAATRIAEVEKQRDVAVNEAVYAKAKLHAVTGGSGANGNMPPADMNNLDTDRASDMNRKLASALGGHAELKTRLQNVTAEVNAEKRARQLADETAAAAQNRVSELDDFRNRTASEVESLRAELLDAERALRDESSMRSDAVAEAKLLRLDKEELTARLEDMLVDNREYTNALNALKIAVVASQDKSQLLERQLEEERVVKENLERKLARIKSEHEERSADLESTSRRLKDTEALSHKHADEAQKAREVMLAGLQKAADREVLDIVGSAANERVLILQEQINNAKSLLDKSKTQADETGEKLANAMQRVAGLELMQAQGSKDAIAMQRRMAETLEELRRLKSDNADLSANLANHKLDAEAAHSKHTALKEILNERGVNTEHSRSRGIGSPASGFDSPDGKTRELEAQLQASMKAHNETKVNADNEAREAEKAFSAKLEELENNYTSVARYVKGTEKMLVRMKEELAKYKNQNGKLQSELDETRNANRSLDASADNSRWEQQHRQVAGELDDLRSRHRELSTTSDKKQRDMQVQMEALVTQHAATAKQASYLQMQLASINQELSTTHEQLQRLESENHMLETRAVDAENKVSSLLDQFESSVDSYRHQPEEHHLSSKDHQHDSSSLPTDPRTSIALDNLATELDQLRSHWENTNKSYRLSSAFDFEKTPTSTEGGELSNSLAQWRQRLDMEEEEARNRRSDSRGSDITSGDVSSSSLVPDRIHNTQHSGII